MCFGNNFFLMSLVYVKGLFLKDYKCFATMQTIPKLIWVRVWIYLNPGIRLEFNFKQSKAFFHISQINSFRIFYSHVKIFIFTIFFLAINSEKNLFFLMSAILFFN